MNINQFDNILSLLKGKTSDSLEYKICKKTIIEMVENDLKEYNPNEIIEQYFEYFSKLNFKKVRINEGDEFYRGRIGKVVLEGAIDDFNRDFIIPFYGKEIEAAPPIYTSGGRFNRAGVSYLYLATELETCLAEVHLQVGQECSVAKFKCVNEVDLINLSDFNGDLELKIWYEILTQPVHEQIKYKYFITQFLSEVLMKIEGSGLYFKSVQSDGYNIVSFNPNNFELIPYSERIYKATSIKYNYIPIEDAIREFANKEDTYLINDLNTDKVEENEKKINYLLKWIEEEKKSSR